MTLYLTNIRARWLITVWCLAFFLCAVYGGNARAQESLRIAAVVNEEIVSAFDLQARLRLIITLSRLPRTDATFKSLMQPTLRALIDEKIKFQEAEKLGITVTQDEMDNSISIIENRNRIKPGNLIDMLEDNAIDPESLFDQLRSEIFWSRIITRKHLSRVTISDEEIDKAVAAEETARNQPKYRISEITIPIESPEKVAQANEQIVNLGNKLRAGADFSALARSFSQSSSASRGGELGSLRSDQIPAEIRAAVTGLLPGQITQPMRVTAGFVMVKLHAIESGTANPKPDAQLKLSQFHLPLPHDAPQNTVSSYMATARKNTEAVQGCGPFSDVSKEIGSPLSGSLGEVLLSKLPPRLQNSIRALPIGKPSAPIRSPDAVIVLMICERTGIPVPDTTVDRDAVKQRILSNRLAVYARQEIRELRRAAYIEIR